jgi:hypothetical protein
MISRREFIRRSGLGAGFLLSPHLLTCAMQKTDENNLHLLFDPSQTAEIKRRLQLPLFEPLWQEMLDADLEDDMKFLQTGIAFNNQLRHLPRVDRILQREAFIYVMSGDRQRGNMATLALEKVLQFEKWDYFLEAGKEVIGLQRAPLTTQSIVVAYPWIEDLLSDELKTAIFEQLPVKGCEPCYRSLWGMLHKEQVVGWGFDPESSYYQERDFRRWPWILARTNLRAVPMSALALGSVFLKGKDDRVPRWMDVVKKSYDDFYDLFDEDGSYNEGTGYCNYTSGELILMLDVLQRRLDKDWSGAINWNGVMDFFLMTYMPSEQHPKGHVNFGDGGSGFDSGVGYWIASKYDNRVAQYAAQNHSRRDNIFSVIWYDPSVEPKKPQGDWFFREVDIGWIVATTGFEKEDFVAALRSGGPANHEHADRNCFIVKCYGENLLADNWRPPYDHNDPGWPLRTSPAHNTVLVDGKGHQYHDGTEGTNASLAEAEIIRTHKNEQYASAISDATQAYGLVNPNIKNVNRSIVVIPAIKVAVIVDCLQSKEDAADFSARWFISNVDGNGRIAIDKNTFTFSRPQAKLCGACAGSKGIRLEQELFPVPVESGIYPYLDVVSAEKSKKVILVTAVVALEKDETATAPQISKHGDTWTINSENLGKRATITVVTTETYPEIAVQLT